MKLDTKKNQKKEVPEVIPRKRGYGLDEYYEEERRTKKAKPKRKVFLILKILLVLLILAVIFIFLFFKTSLFQKYKELWVQTAMTTMNHQYLATLFLSDEEIEEIMKKLEVENNENSNSDNIVVGESQEEKEIKIEKITGKGYVGFVMIVPDATKVKLVDGRLSRKRLKTK